MRVKLADAGCLAELCEKIFTKWYMKTVGDEYHKRRAMVKTAGKI
jgi:hypothetical protein